MSFDLGFFKLINGLAGHTPVLDQIMQALVSDYVGPTLQVLALFGFWFEGRTADDRRENQRAVLRAAVALVLSGLLVGVCNLFYFRDRPFRYHEVNLLFYYPTDSSFPSNSAAVVFSLAATIWCKNRRWGWPMMVLAWSFAFARVYCGVHYPADILSGFAIGSGSAWLLKRYGRPFEALFDFFIGLARRAYLA